MKNIREFKNSVVLPFLLTAVVVVPFNANAASELDTVVANTISSGDNALINNLLSELAPKANKVCQNELPDCAKYSAYVDDLTAALGVH